MYFRSTYQYKIPHEISRKSEEGPQRRRIRISRLQIRLETGRGAKELVAHSHDCLQRTDFVQTYAGGIAESYSGGSLRAQLAPLKTTIRSLTKTMLQGEFKPVKFFSIDRVFRNETLDATHLAEFHQVEGVIADYGLTLGDLTGVLYEFFKKLGITQLQFKPAYNPYTEPSMEIFCYHEGLGKWIETGNSGMFRPEMLLPMNLPPNVNVIAWGLSLERYKDRCKLLDAAIQRQDVNIMPFLIFFYTDRQ